MKIGVDISQVAYEGTGVANFLKNTLAELVKQDKNNEFVFFYSSFRRKFDISMLGFSSIPANLRIKTYKFPPSLLHLLWNRLHILSIERLIGDVDIFLSSDWTEPPVKKAKKATILYDLVVYLYPAETDQKIISVQKKKLDWVKKECDLIFCISESTKQDAKRLLGIAEEKLQVVYPGITV